ncbi:MAG: hypothetical protein R3Y38_06690, partial [Rikenellaceae bacterium]
KNVYTGSYQDDKTSSSYTFDGENGNSVVSQAAYDYATTVASASHGLTTVNGLNIVETAYSGAYSLTNEQDWNMSSAWGTRVKGYIE